MGKQTIAVLDYGSGNLRSAAKAFEFVAREEGLDAEIIITDRAETIACADRIVLPGQGAYGDCIRGLRAAPGMVDALESRVRGDGAPFFGICVGMQLLSTRGLEFGEHRGLGWIDGDVVKMTPSDPALKIPHMGWNGLCAPADGALHPVLQGITKKPDGHFPDFYFVHSFVFQSKNANDVAAWCDYGGNFAAVVAKDNLVGTQFHPEKSQKAGLELIRGFLTWKP